MKEITNLAAELSFWNKIKVDTSEQSGKPTLQEFPTSPYVYHFHPIAFVEQMKRGEKKGEKCVCEERVRAYMRMLRVGEGTLGESGYTKLFGGGNFTKSPHNKDMSDHPQISVYWYTKKDGTKVYSSAAGAYQVMAYTWNDNNMKTQRKNYKINDFSSENQDKFCLILFKHKRAGMLDLIIEGKIKEATEKYGSYEWASLPPGRYGQPIKTMEQTLALYNKFFKEECEGISDLHLNKGFLKEFGYVCKCENNEEQAVEEYNVNVLFDNANDSNTVSAKSINIIKKIGNASKNPTIHITSSVRTPRKQAEIMYDQTVSLGTTAQYKLYGSNGDKIIDVYVAKKKEKKTKEEIIQAMENKINEIGAYKVSNHCGNHLELNVFDISRSRLKNPSDFLTEANKYLNSEIKKIINETDRGCYHFEIKQ